jgi:hypothetical protein
MKTDGEHFRLAIPIPDALAFAMGWSDLEYSEPRDALRQLIGVFAVDALQYAEQWRAAALARALLEEKWPGCFEK